MLKRVFGWLVNVVLTWVSMLYAILIGCFLPCLRGTAAHTIAQQLIQQRSSSASSPTSSFYPHTTASSAFSYDLEDPYSSSSLLYGGDGTIGNNASGGGTCQFMDILFWGVALFMPVAVTISLIQSASIFTKLSFVAFVVLPAVLLWVVRRIFMSKRVAFHRMAARASASARTSSARNSGGGDSKQSSEEMDSLIHLSHTHTFSIGFFHPNCDAGGGGERVLWQIIAHLLSVPALSEAHLYIYCQRPTKKVPDVYGGERLEHVSSVALLRNVGKVFNIHFTAAHHERIHFVWLESTHFLDPSRYSRFTLILQALGSVIPAFEALSRHNPHVMIDTCGYPTIYPVFKLLGGCEEVICYTHYPTISRDMLERVRSVKHLYYRLFAQYYALFGRCVDTIMVNSSWTLAQLRAVWGIDATDSYRTVHCVYPPCLVSDAVSHALQPREPFILSVAQFRPEKRHDFQIEVFKVVLDRYRAKHAGTAKAKFADSIRLVLVGTVREADLGRLASYRRLASTLGVANEVVFDTDVEYKFLHSNYLSKALIGLHCMKDEHFGIGVVELMASGCLTVAHRSAGPLMDIIVPADEGGNNQTGFLADTAEQYATAILSVIERYEQASSSSAALNGVSLQTIQTNARNHVQRFSVDAFCKRLDSCLVPRLTAISTVAESAASDRKSEN